MCLPRSKQFRVICAVVLAFIVISTLFRTSTNHRTHQNTHHTASTNNSGRTRYSAYTPAIPDTTNHSSPVGCEPGIPCRYPELVDFRVIVIAYDRNKSLRKLLESLDALELDGDSARLEIWLDRGWNGAVHRPTFDVARV